MELVKGKSNYILNLKSVTWYKDSHSLFDYQSSKVNTMPFTFPLSTKTVTLYRKRQSCNVIALDQTQDIKFDPEEYQFLTKFQIKPTHNSRIRINFINDCQKKLRKVNSERLNTDESISSVTNKEEETYIIVRKQKDINGQARGYKLEAGQTIKLGRVQYYVSQICIGETVTTAKASKERIYAHRNVMKYTPEVRSAEIEKRQCKICLEDTEEKDNFLFNPCKCSGSCGTVHLDCLLQWIHVKVKKEVVGGTLHYNFDKFECEVCKSQLPMVIECEGKVKELLPIEKTKGSYLILEAACEKTKSVMMIKNVPEDGIKLGRGHECEIRITDISVSRNHALIKYVNDAFIVFDNKSKFGTLVKQEKLHIELGNRCTQGIQVGRTVITFDIRKEKELKEGETAVTDKVEVKGDKKLEKKQVQFRNGSRRNIIDKRDTARNDW